MRVVGIGAWRVESIHLKRNFCGHASRHRHRVGSCGDPAFGPGPRELHGRAARQAYHDSGGSGRRWMEVRANSVYTIPPNTFLFIQEGKLHLTEPIKRDGIRMPIDFFFRSLARTNTKGDRCTAIRQWVRRNPRNTGGPWRRRYCPRPGPSNRSVRFYAPQRDGDGAGGLRAAGGATTCRDSGLCAPIRWRRHKSCSGDCGRQCPIDS